MFENKEKINTKKFTSQIINIARRPGMTGTIPESTSLSLQKEKVNSFIALL
jgi:hypothetical protein